MAKRHKTKRKTTFEDTNPTRKWGTQQIIIAIIGIVIILSMVLSTLFFAFSQPV